ncbi:MAG: UbiA family prenyltransferase [Acidobacteria bacterium]|nr:UbiA family prenyltransferase [Acidobacteriota bacterium]
MPANSWRAAVRSLRPAQWSKNLLLFLPAVCAHQFHSAAPWLACALGFVCFSAAASAQYLLNDLMDLDADRSDPAKRVRPLAAGAMTAAVAWALAVLLGGFSLAAATLLPPPFFALLCAYHAGAAAYSLRIKRWLAADIALLAGFYELRVFAGGAAAGVAVSDWLAAFSGFLFFSLAILKRCSGTRTAEGAGRRLYSSDDLAVLRIFGVACGCIAVVVLALYIQHPQVAAYYSHPRRLWLLCPALLIWIVRAWLRGTREGADDDRLAALLVDPASWAVLAAAGAVLFLAL